MTTMSRKSARLKSRNSIDEPHSAAILGLCRKRKAEEQQEIENEMMGNNKRRNFRIENIQIPISHESAITTSRLVPTAEQLSPVSDAASPELGARFRFRNYFKHTPSFRYCPLPKFSWANSEEVWKLMTEKEDFYTRNPHALDGHPTLEPRMRTILLGWLMEVCEVNRFHRETYYLAMDLLDRIISSSLDAHKDQLQLIGITCLFIASKVEEMYPPKVAEFAFLTDGACTDKEILDLELVLLKILNWDVNPVTSNGWLNLFLQVGQQEDIEEPEHGFMFSQYSSNAYVQISQVMDLAMLDIGCLGYLYSAIAASAIYHLTDKDIAVSLSGYKWEDLLPCVNWMTPFAQTIRERGPITLKVLSNVDPLDCHNIQTYGITIDLFERAKEIEEELMSLNRSSSPDVQAQVITQLTPPSSDSKEKASVVTEREYLTETRYLEYIE